MTEQLPQRTRRYENLFMDSARWDGFEPRPDDIFICTPYKSGTTWMQMICALLIFKTPKLPQPLAAISPWIDMRVTPVEETLRRYAEQTHRRIIKTHTALDGLPYFPQATYLYCARDPREIFISMWHHAKNQRIPHLVSLLVEQGIEVPPPPAVPEDIDERFQLWLTKPAFPWEQDGFPFWSVFSHAKTFWQFRARENIHFLHYADLMSDLDGQMRRIASILGITVDEELWPHLVAAATFSSMKENADMTAPDTDLNAWQDNAAFFHRGGHGQWRELLSADSVNLYETVRHEKGPAEFVDYLERGLLATGMTPP